MMISTTLEISSPVSTRPLAIPYHFNKHPRQQVAVACCALNAGWPLNGVC